MKPSKIRQYIPGRYRVVRGDSLAVLKKLPPNSVDAIVTDPPYGIAFMGQKWDSHKSNADYQVWCRRWASLCLRALKPGGYLVAFCGTRTYHRMAAGIEDAGFEIRDQLAWAYGSGFPKSRGISKDVDRILGSKRKVVGKVRAPGFNVSQVYHGKQNASKFEYDLYDAEPVSDEAKRWHGWGTALKPAWEPICLAQKRPDRKPIAKNVMHWGTGALNIDATRVGPALPPTVYKQPVMNGGNYGRSKKSRVTVTKSQGRWPANICHDGSDEVVAHFPNLHGAGAKRIKTVTSDYDASSYRLPSTRQMNRFGDSGSAARFFYCAKACKRERSEGIHLKNDHPTVKPVALMRWLVRLVAPKRGVVLDPFTGSGTTGIAANLEGAYFFGIEREKKFHAIAESRIKAFRAYAETPAKAKKVVKKTQAAESRTLFGEVKRRRA